MSVERPPCNLGVGCDDYGICYASMHGVPENCPHYRADKYRHRGLIILASALIPWAIVLLVVFG